VNRISYLDWTRRKERKRSIGAAIKRNVQVYKNKRTTPEKIKMKKYDPKTRNHVMCKETELK
jgi:ribosomal protein L33